MTTLKIALVGVVLAALAGCGGTPSTVTVTVMPTATVTAQPTTEPIEEPTPSESSFTDEEKFLEAVHDAAPQTYELSDNQLVEVGTTVCDAMDKGVTPKQVLREVVKAAKGDADMGNSLTAVVAAGIVYFCPRHQAAMQAYVDR